MKITVANCHYTTVDGEPSFRPVGQAVRIYGDTPVFDLEVMADPCAGAVVQVLDGDQAVCQAHAELAETRRGAESQVLRAKQRLQDTRLKRAMIRGGEKKDGVAR